MAPARDPNRDPDVAMGWTAVYGFPECAEGARRLAESLGISCRIAELHRFPDGESLVRLPEPAECAIVYRPLHRPNDKLVELVLAASVLRRGGARQLCLIAPYLPYMRQDAVFRPGEPVSQMVVGALLADHFDRVIGVEPHLHRTTDMTAIFPGIRAEALPGARPIGAWLAERRLPAETLVVGPDEESAPLVRGIAEPLGLEWSVGSKQRRGDYDVTVMLSGEADPAGRPVVIADDVISSGQTVLDCARAVLERGARRVEVVVVHALHDPAAELRFRDAGIAAVVSCDGVPHPSNHVPLAATLADALSR